MRERDFQDMVLRAAGYLGWTCYHTHDSRHSPEGFPDLICAKDGQMLAIELKRRRDRTAPARMAKQLAWLELLGSVPGVTAMIARPDDWPRVLEALGGES